MEQLKIKTSRSRRSISNLLIPGFHWRQSDTLTFGYGVDGIYTHQFKHQVIAMHAGYLVQADTEESVTLEDAPSSGHVTETDITDAVQ